MVEPWHMPAFHLPVSQVLFFTRKCYYWIFSCIMTKRKWFGWPLPDFHTHIELQKVNTWRNWFADARINVNLCKGFLTLNCLPCFWWCKVDIIFLTSPPGWTMPVERLSLLPLLLSLTPRRLSASGSSCFTGSVSETQGGQRKLLSQLTNHVP